MKRRWKALIGLGAAAFLFAAVPISYVEFGCRGDGDAAGAAAPYRALAGRGRPEARTWLTYPEWHIVYAAESLGAWLASGQRPSAYPYLRDAGAFWSSFCAVARVSHGRPNTGPARVMLHTIGVSFMAEMLVKSAYENTLGRLSEALAGWTSTDDRYAARVQQRYGAFMHEVPWYGFPFGQALSDLWALDGSGFRHWERRAALTSEYGVKAGYAKLIGGASDTMGPDETRMGLVLRASPEQVRALDTRLVPVKPLGRGLTLVDTPRYATFTDILLRLAAQQADLVEVSGNDDIFLTVLVPKATPPAKLPTLLTADLPDGRQRRGLSVKVPQLLPLIRAVQAGGGEIEHVYDY